MRERKNKGSTTRDLREVLGGPEVEYRTQAQEYAGFHAELTHLIRCLDISLGALKPGDPEYELVFWKHRLVNAAADAGLNMVLALVMLRGLARTVDSVLTQAVANMLQILREV